MERVARRRVPTFPGQRHRRAGNRVLHDRVHVDHVDRVQSEPAEGVQSEPGAGRRGVRRDAGQDILQDGRRRDTGPAASGHHDAVADVRAERGAVRADAVGRLVERPDAAPGAVHAVAAVRRAGAQRRATGVRLPVPPAAHGGGRRGRDCAAGPHRRTDAHHHDRVQLRRRHHVGQFQWRV